MDSTQRTSDPETVSRTRGTPFAALRESVLLKLAAVGLLQITLGAIINEGIWAAIVAVWGAGLVLVGLGLYGFIWWRRN
ncbi:hypothetical protein [Natrinema salifodinae]|uniref:Uncharacterized protein n=1 Tax=Natrinema salifodinae TaxID=1202768 RepID=A0A1I0QUG4_9EURY|nr:hypothetical protein [Natrinema salifodinae]SEW31227.1 hypothetical protein SAMN05216285_3970 [Natrinema salifodinae]